MTPDEKKVALAMARKRLKAEGCGPLHVARCLKYESRVLDLQAEGIDRGDAQGIAEV